jgi:hypothetical protein
MHKLETLVEGRLEQLRITDFTLFGLVCSFKEGELQ